MPYTNGPIHIGHMAGVYVPADAYVRFLRIQKKDVAFVCGSDQHGVAILMRAHKEGKKASEIAEHYHHVIKDSLEKFGISFDFYNKTSSEVHKKNAQDFFYTLYKKDTFIKKKTEQLYDPSANLFLSDRYITGTCPNCDHPEAYGDQCENCGKSLSPTDLLHPTSVLTGATPVLKKTTHWYLPLEEYKSFLKGWLSDKKDNWKPSVYNLLQGWLEQPLPERALTRDLDWGISIPITGLEGKVMYVWFEAPIGYISATQEWAATHKKNWQDYWQNPDTAIVHFIGKDNIVFHCLIFPIMLHAHGQYSLPYNVPANEFMNLEGKKISTSKNWAVWLDDYMTDFPEMQDSLRYTLISNLPDTKDSDFTWKDFQTKHNSELVSIYGNLVNRIFVLSMKYYGGKLAPDYSITAEDDAFLYSIQKQFCEVEKLLFETKIRLAMCELMTIARLTNKYLTDEAPWQQTDTLRRDTAMYVAVQALCYLAVASEPFLPTTAHKLQSALGIKSSLWSSLKTSTTPLPTGHTLKPLSHLFTRIEDKVIEAQITKLESGSEKAKPMKDTPIKKEIPFDAFDQVDLRTGLIKSAKKVPKTSKLLQFEIEIGTEVRTIVSGLAERYTPESLVGATVCVVTNLKPRKIRGILSQGMILTAESKDGTLSIITPRESGIESGGSIS